MSAEPTEKATKVDVEGSRGSPRPERLPAERVRAGESYLRRHGFAVVSRQVRKCTALFACSHPAVDPPLLAKMLNEREDSVNERALAGLLGDRGVAPKIFHTGEMGLGWVMVVMERLDMDMQRWMIANSVALDLSLIHI